jgi:hypothetical protein
MHETEPPTGATHVLPQRPQLVTVVLRLVSQPSALAPLQLPKPTLHAAMPHTPAEHEAVPLAMEHTFPQRPQLATVVLRFTSQPSLTTPLQSANPALHMPMPHTPPVQLAVALGGFAQRRAHAPQLFTSVLIDTSQPFAALRSQSSVPARHEPMPHTPMRHCALPLGGSGQRLLQRPQWLRSEVIATSQPSAGDMLQLAKPSLQVPT